MGVKLIKEARRMQLLAGLITEFKMENPPPPQHHVLDIGIPYSYPKAKYIWNSIKETYESDDSGSGFGFYNAQFSFEDRETAEKVLQEIISTYKIDFFKEGEDVPYASIFTEDEDAYL